MLMVVDLFLQYAIPTDRTTYVCELMKVPKFDGKHHIIKVCDLHV